MLDLKRLGYPEALLGLKSLAAVYVADVRHNRWDSLPPDVLGLSGLVVLNASDNNVRMVAEGEAAGHAHQPLMVHSRAALCHQALALLADCAMPPHFLCPPPPPVAGGPLWLISGGRCRRASMHPAARRLKHDCMRACPVCVGACACVRAQAWHLTTWACST